MQRDAPESIMASNRFVRGAFFAGKAMLTFSVTVVEKPPSRNGNVLYGSFRITLKGATKTSES